MSMPLYYNVNIYIIDIDYLCSFLFDNNTPFC